MQVKKFDLFLAKCKFLDLEQKVQNVWPAIMDH